MYRDPSISIHTYIAYIHIPDLKDQHAFQRLPLPSGALPYFSFCWLLGDLPAPRHPSAGISEQHAHKWRCLLSYFERTTERRRGPHAHAWGGRAVCFSRMVADTSELEIDGSWSTNNAPVSIYFLYIYLSTCPYIYI